MPVPTIRIDDDVYERLKLEAEAFVDTPNTVLRRLLELDPEVEERPIRPAGRRSRRMRPGELLNRQEYDLLILEVLARQGGSGYAPDVVEEVGKLVEDKLTQGDHELNNSGVIRWKNRVMWRRFKLVEMGLLKHNSPRGQWELSDSGREALAAGEINYS